MKIDGIDDIASKKPALVALVKAWIDMQDGGGPATANKKPIQS